MAASFIPLFLMLWLPTQPSGTPPTAKQAFRYVPRAANFVASFDLRSIAASAQKKFAALEKQPFVAKVKEIAKGYSMIKMKKNQFSTMAKVMAGFDPFADLHHVTIGAVVTQNSEPRFVAAVTGNIPADAAQRIAAQNRGKAAQALPNGTLFESRSRRQPSFGQTKDGVFLVGHTALLRGLLKAKPRRSKLVRKASALYNKKTFGMLYIETKDRQLLDKVARKMGPAVGKLGKDFVGFGAAMRYDGMSIVLAAKTGATRLRYRKLLDGLGHYLAAGQRIVQGTLSIIDGLLPNRVGQVQKQPLKGIVRHKKALLAYLKRHFPTGTAAHTVKMETRHLWARLDFKGAGYLGILPAFGAGGWLFLARGNAPVPMPIRPSAKSAAPRP
jgi:hypothetical protein